MHSVFNATSLHGVFRNDTVTPPFENFLGSKTLEVRYEFFAMLISIIPWNVLLLSLCSSIDNFTVGVAFGASGGKSSISVLQNFVISFANAVGQGCFMLFGVLISTGLERLFAARFLGLLPAFVFFYLAGKEFFRARNRIKKQFIRANISKIDEKIPLLTNYAAPVDITELCAQKFRKTAPLTERQKIVNKIRKMTWMEALSMSVALSLSNMAAGLAGGMSAMSPLWGVLSAFAISFLMMDLGVRLMSDLRNTISFTAKGVQYFSATLFSFLAVYNVATVFL
eukprot:gene444-889_t